MTIREAQKMRDAAAKAASVAYGEYFEKQYSDEVIADTFYAKYLKNEDVYRIAASTLDTLQHDHDRAWMEAHPVDWSRIDVVDDEPRQRRLSDGFGGVDSIHSDDGRMATGKLGFPGAGVTG